MEITASRRKMDSSIHFLFFLFVGRTGRTFFFFLSRRWKQVSFLGRIRRPLRIIFLHSRRVCQQFFVFLQDSCSYLSLEFW